MCRMTALMRVNHRLERLMILLWHVIIFLLFFSLFNVCIKREKIVQYSKIIPWIRKEQKKFKIEKLEFDLLSVLPHELCFYTNRSKRRILKQTCICTYIPRRDGSECGDYITWFQNMCWRTPMIIKFQDWYSSSFKKPNNPITLLQKFKVANTTETLPSPVPVVLVFCLRPHSAILARIRYFPSSKSPPETKIKK